MCRSEVQSIPSYQINCILTLSIMISAMCINLESFYCCNGLCVSVLYVVCFEVLTCLTTFSMYSDYPEYLLYDDHECLAAIQNMFFWKHIPPLSCLVSGQLWEFALLVLQFPNWWYCLQGLSCLPPPPPSSPPASLPPPYQNLEPLLTMF